MADYYRILGVSRNAGPDEIKRAFRQLARRQHTDVSERSGGRFREILDAYETLSDERQRRIYDARLATDTGSAGLSMDQRHWFADEVDIDFPSVARVLELMRAAFFTRDETTPRLSAEVELSAREAIRGAVVPLQVPIRRSCPTCGGRGEVWMDLCRGCCGTGEAAARYPVRLTIPAGVRDGTCVRFHLTPPYALPTSVEIRIAIR